MPTYNSLVRTAQGGTTQEIASGGTVDISGQVEVESGGTLRVKSGGYSTVDSGGTLAVASSGALTIGGSALTNTFVDSVAAGYKIATGTAVFSNSGTVNVVTGLTTVVNFVAMAFGAGTSNISGQAAWYEGSILGGGTGGTVAVYAYATTGTAVNTSKAIHWTARGN